MIVIKHLCDFEIGTNYLRCLDGPVFSSILYGLFELEYILDCEVQRVRFATPREIPKLEGIYIADIGPFAVN